MRLFPLLQKRQRTVLTWQGKILAALLALTALVTLVRTLHPFLAANDPVYGGPLVVEGWMPDFALRAAITEFQRHPYSMMLVTGGPIESGQPWTRFGDYADYGVATLEQFGFPKSHLRAIPSAATRQDRTYASAVALVRTLQSEKLPLRFEVMSLGPHARRTRLLFEKACSGHCEVGILAVEDHRYDAVRWWTSSAGFRDVIGESIAYIYARLLFWPSHPDTELERANADVRARV